MDKLSNKRILITGGTGHIGSHVVARLAPEATYLLIVARDVEELRCDVAWFDSKVMTA